MWSVYNGATYYIDVFGKRFQNELEAMRRDIQKWQNNEGEGGLTSPLMTPKGEGSELAKALAAESASGGLDKIPLLNEERGATTGLDGGAKDVARERKVGDLPA